MSTANLEQAGPVPATSKRARGVEYFIKALSTGERTAAQRLEPFLAVDVEYETSTQPGAVPIGRETFKGRQAVLNQVFGLWPATPGYSRLGWSEPVTDDDDLKVTTSGPVEVTFSFSEKHEIRRVCLEGGYGSGASAPAPSGGPVDEIPLAVKGLINNALANQTPVVVTYVAPDGVPHSSLRGSTTVLGPTEMGIWVRHADGGLVRAVRQNPSISFFYSDRRANVAVSARGSARVAEDAEDRRRLYERIPEVEQTHDPGCRGVAVLVEVTQMQANLGQGRGSYLLERG
jgi:hypothetical protein